MWSLFNAIAIYGYWTHFVHPDDVISDDRGMNKTWKEIKLKFEVAEKPVLLFTATPFRNDGGRIEGEIIYNYPLSLAQRDRYYEKINLIYSDSVIWMFGS